MHPYLFHVGRLTVSSFSVMVALGVVVPALLVMPPLMRRHRVPLAFLSWGMVASVVGGTIGARLWNIAEHWPPTLIALWNGGLTWYGAMLGGFLAVLLVCLWRGVPPGLWFNLYVPAVALGYAIGRVGCLLAGDGDYGKPSGLPWAMTFAHGVVPTPPGVTVHPTPIYESLAMLVISSSSTAWRGSRSLGGWSAAGSSSSPAPSASSSSSCAAIRTGWPVSPRPNGCRSSPSCSA